MYHRCIRSGVARPMLLSGRKSRGRSRPETIRTAVFFARVGRRLESMPVGKTSCSSVLDGRPRGVYVYHGDSVTAPLALTPGRVYRTRELRAFTANPTRWAKRLVEQGVLRQPHHGLYYAPVPTNFGLLGPTTAELLRAFLDGDDFLITGPYFWNALGLGTTQMFAVSLVYNRKHTGIMTVGGHRIWFRRVRFPSPPPLEWFVVDLLHNERHMGEDTSHLDELLVRALRKGRFDAERLHAMATEYAHPAARARIFAAIDAARVPA